MRNPFIPMAAGAWTAFLIVTAVVEQNKYGWMYWAIWLTVVTLIPIVYWVIQRKKS